MPEVPAIVDGVAPVSYNFSGTVDLGGCSGNLIRFVTSETTDKALILTNGHCYQLLDLNEVVVDMVTSRSFILLDAGGSALGTLTAKKILYATMTGTDVAIYQLTQTYEQISAAYQILPLTLAKENPQPLSAINIISGGRKRGYTCTIDAIVDTVKEGAWVWHDSIRYRQPGCNVVGGTSGSPIVDMVSGLVIAINNTKNMDGGQCSENNPCEVDAAGNIAAAKGNAYGQQTYWIYTCLGLDRKIDLEQDGCMLPKPQNQR